MKHCFGEFFWTRDCEAKFTQFELEPIYFFRSFVASRPGRLEVQVEVPLPSKDGRREILNIHFGPLRSRGRLSYPLCCAIDGVRRDGSISKETMEIPRSRGNRRIKLRSFLRSFTVRDSEFMDLADDAYTGGFSGADIAGLVRNAGSIALARARIDGGGVNGLLVTLEDVKDALSELKM